MKIYVRISSDGYEGQSLRFATLDENKALTFFTSGDSANGDYAPKWDGEELMIFDEGGEYEEVFSLRGGKWWKNYYSKEREEYGVIVVEPHEYGLQGTHDPETCTTCLLNL